MKRFLFCIALLASVPAGAHDLWMERDGGGVTLYYGHRHAAHAGENLMEYDPGIVMSADCYSADGDTVTAAVSDRYPVHMATACAVSCILVTTGYWTKTPYGTKNIPKNQATYPLESWLSYESVKRIDGWNDAFARPLLRELDIVPLENPLKLKTGKKLRLLVTFGGEPVAGAVVSYRGSPRGTTGEDGTINVRIKESGFQIIQAGYSVPLGSDEADTIIYTANLNFEIEED